MKSDSYFEILVEPYSYQEIFLDFVVQNIETCVEEVITPYHLSHQGEDIADFDLSQFFKPEEQKFHQFIVRTPRDPHEVLEMLRSFCDVLALRVKEEVSFGFGYRVCQNKDWIEAYRQSILPVSAGGFYIHPSWHKSAKEEGLDLQDIVIDPALAFGSGHHATTSMCLEFLGSMDLRDKKVLDVGCGSGILSIASSMLGASVEMCDTDSLAIEESHKNFSLNAQSFVRSWVGSISSSNGEYDVIVANILASIIMMLKRDFTLRLKEGGALILSGILDEYKEAVFERFCDFGVEQILEKDGWVALKLIKLK